MQAPASSSANIAVDRSRLTQAGMMVGTVSYMPPEQATGSATLVRP